MLTDEEFNLFCSMFEEIKQMKVEIVRLRAGLDRVNCREMAIKNPWQI